MRWAGMRAFAAIALGIALQAWASIPLWLLLMGLGLVLAAESLTWSHKDSIQSRSSRGRRSIQAVGVCRILLLFGLSLAGAVSYASRTGLYLRLPFLRHVRATGTVMSEPLPVQGIRSYEFRLDSIEVAGQKFPAGLKVRFSSGRYFRYGSRLCVVGDIAPFHYPRNPGLIDLNTYYQRQGFVGMVRAYDLVRVLPGVGGCAPIREVVMPLRRHFVGTVGRYFVGKERGLLAGLLLGEGGDLSPETREEFVRSGLAHILAVSGLNVSIVVGVCVLVLSLLGIRDRLAFACTTVMTLLYVAITGWSASAARAGLMAILASIGLAFERRYDPLNGVCVAGIVLLLLDPLVVFDPGFQLSFAATAGIVAFLPLARPTIRRLVPNRRVRGWLVWPVAVVLVAQLCAFPLTLYYFHQVSLVAWLANLVAMPFVTLATPLGLLLVAVAPFSSHIAQLLANTLGLVTSGIIRLTEQFGSADWAMIVTGQPKLWIVVWLYCLVALLVAIRQRWAQRALVAIALGGLGFLAWSNALSPEQVEVTFLDTVDGEATFFTCLGQSVLIDAGSPDNQIVEHYLRSKGRTGVDLLFVTRLSPSSCAAVQKLLGRMKIGRLLVPSQGLADSAVRSLMACARQQGVPVTALLVGDEVRFTRDSRVRTDHGSPPIGSSTDSLPAQEQPDRRDRRPEATPVIRVLVPSRNLAAAAQAGLLGPEQLPAVLKIVCGKRSVLLAGALRDPRLVLDSDVSSELLLMPQHGSIRANSEEFLDAVRPKVAVLSGRLSPSPVLAERIRKRGIRLHCLRQDGALVWPLRDRPEVDAPAGGQAQSASER